MKGSVQSMELFIKVSYILSNPLLMIFMIVLHFIQCHFISHWVMDMLRFFPSESFVFIFRSSSSSHHIYKWLYQTVCCGAFTLAVGHCLYPIQHPNATKFICWTCRIVIYEPQHLPKSLYVVAISPVTQANQVNENWFGVD